MIKRSCKLLKLLGVASLGMAIMSFPTYSADERFPNIVSLDYCADQFVLLLSNRQQITAVSKAAEDVYSFYRERAKGLAKTNSTIEEVIQLKPDVAIQTYTSAAHMADMMERSNVSLVATLFGSDPETVYKNITLVGDAINQSVRANEFNENYKKRLEVLKGKKTSKFKLAYITPSGVTAGAGTSVDDIITLSGFKNYTAAIGHKGWVSLPLENLILDPPDAFITSFFERNATTQSRWSLSRHDFLFNMMERIPTINLPSTHMSCNGLFRVDAAELIRKEALAANLLSKSNEVVD